MNIVELEGIPGTETMFKGSQSTDGLKTHGDIILVPQPSDSINDPLNWSRARRYWSAALVLSIVGLTAATSNSASAAQDGITSELDVTDADFNNGAGVLFLAIGYWTLLSAPSVYLWGTRPSYLIGLLFGIIGNAWYAKTRNSTDAIWSQLFIGASESVAEATAQLSLSQVFFQHNMGNSLGLYVLATSVGTFLGPFIAGFAADNLGWQWVGWLALIVNAGFFVVAYFGLEETYFDRNKYLPQKYGLTTVTSAKDKEVEPMRSTVRPIKDTDVPPPDVPTPYWKRIAVFTPASNLQGWGFKQYIKRLGLMMRVFTFPAVIYSGLQWGFQDAWLTFYISAESELWTSDPYNYSDAALAIMNIPTLIGAIVGCVWGSWVSDWLVLHMARRNHGVKEAESRLYAMLVAGVISPVGMWMFGFGTARQWDWRIPYVGLGFIGFGFGCCGDLSMAYLTDAYPDMVLEGMVGVAVINNTLAMAFSFACDPWLDKGVENCFIAIGVVDFVVIMLSIPMIIWGKQFRRWTAQMYFNFVRDRDSLESTALLDEPVEPKPTTLAPA